MWEVPLLPMPRSSDISPVSSDMYFSPIEIDDVENCCQSGNFSAENNESAGTYRVLSDGSSGADSSWCRPLSTIEENTSSGDVSCPWATTCKNWL